jgi:hypothetical protein
VLDHQGYRRTLRICNTVCQGNNVFMNAPQCYVYKYIACLIIQEVLNWKLGEDMDNSERFMWLSSVHPCKC